MVFGMLEDVFWFLIKYIHVLDVLCASLPS